MTIHDLAKELHTRPVEILKWASEFSKNDERIEGEEVPRLIENFVRTKHLQATHPELFVLLDKTYSSDLAYERWVAMLQSTIENRGG